MPEPEEPMLTQTRLYPDASDPTIVIARDGAIRRGAALFRSGLLLVERLFDALHKSRARQAAQTIHRHRFLIDEAREYEARRQNEPRATVRGLPSTPSPSSWWD
jgi:hypothetical protein